MKVIRETREVIVKHGHWTADGYVEDAPSGRFLVELAIDIDGLFADIGHKAARSKGGKSVDAGGLVTAKRVVTRAK